MAKVDRSLQEMPSNCLIHFCVRFASLLFELPQYSVMFSAAVDGSYFNPFYRLLLGILCVRVETRQLMFI